MLIRGCLPRLLSLLFLCVWIVGVVLLVAYGPHSAIFGFCLGLGSVGLIFFLGMRFPALVTVAQGSSGDARALSRAVNLAGELSGDREGASRGVSWVLGWALTIVFAGFTLLFAIFTIALLIKNEISANLTAAAFGCGFWATLTWVMRKITARAASK